MQRESRLAELFKMAARQAKAERAAGMSIMDQVKYILLVAGRQHVSRREYTQAREYTDVYRLVKPFNTVQSAWDEIQRAVENASSSTGQTPVSNTGVTGTGAAVPSEYFEGPRK